MQQAWRAPMRLSYFICDLYSGRLGLLGDNTALGLHGAHNEMQVDAVAHALHVARLKKSPQANTVTVSSPTVHETESRELEYLVPAK